MRQRCLFKGNSCFPLSPKSGPNSNSRVINSGDQLIKIIEILPKLKRQDISFVTDSSAIDYVNKLKLKSDAQKLDLKFQQLISGQLKEYSDLF